MANTSKPDDATTTAGVSTDGPSKDAKSGAPMSDEGSKLATEATPKALKSAVKLDDKTLLQAKAIELNIEVDPDWDEQRLRAEIQMAREGRADLQVKGATPPAGYGDVDYDAATKGDKDTEIMLDRDYWPEDGTGRVAAGTKVKMTKAEARKVAAAGVGRSTVNPLA